MSEELFPVDNCEIRVISLWLPWAWWVIVGWKTIETRLHARFKGLAQQRIGIQAAHVWDTAAFDVAGEWLTADRKRETIEVLKVARFKYGGHLLGTVFVPETRWLNAADSPAAMIDCAPTPFGQPTRFGLILQDPKQLPAPIPMKGKQGIWRYKLAA